MEIYFHRDGLINNPFSIHIQACIHYSFLIALDSLPTVEANMISSAFHMDVSVFKTDIHPDPSVGLYGV